jgi:hypothetical protein
VGAVNDDEFLCLIRWDQSGPHNLAASDLNLLGLRKRVVACIFLQPIPSLLLGAHLEASLHKLRKVANSASKSSDGVKLHW